MNYYDPTKTGTAQSFHLNTMAKPSDTIEWFLTKEGDDSYTHTFTTQSAQAIFEDKKYYQLLGVNFTELGFNLENETWYTMKATVGTKVVYRGRLLSTDKDISAYTFSNDYTQNPNNNEYIILD